MGGFVVTTAFVHGFVLALGLILPLGPQNVFVFNQGAVRNNYLRVLAVVIAASLCDTMLILLAVLGVAVLVLHSLIIKAVLFTVGVIFLTCMGWAIWHDHPVVSSGTTDPSTSCGKLIAVTVSLSLLNPHAILDTVAVIGTASLGYSGDARVAFTAACVLVSWVWFFTLALAGRITRQMDPSGSIIRGLNLLSAVIMWTCAAYLGRQLWEII